MIPLSAKSFESCFEKIALSVLHSMHSERENADLQPLTKNKPSISTPQDKAFQKRMIKSTIRLSHLEDKRMTHQHLRKKRGRYFRY